MENQKPKTFVMGDIHGAHKAFKQCLERSGFNKEVDTLIQLGDVVDGLPEVPETIEELLSIENLIQIKGNHDDWFNDWMQWGRRPDVWSKQGGQATIDAYVRRPELMRVHRDYFKNKPVFYVDSENRFYCHGGFDTSIPIERQSEMDIMWDRTLAEKAVLKSSKGVIVKKYKEIYLGHTTVNSFPEHTVKRNKPFISGNVILMDTGAGWEGLLSIMNVDTKEVFQSDLVNDLYPNLNRVWSK